MPPPPNILWIVTTQWRAQATGYAGDGNARTPWLDGLASESVNYTQAVTPHPLGPQARAALLTGQLCPENGVRDYWDPLPFYAPRGGFGAPGGPGGPVQPSRSPAGAGTVLPATASTGARAPRLQPGRTVAHALNDRGYATGFFGKWHLAPRDRTAPLVGEAHAKQIVPPERRGGFQLWEGFEGGFLLNDPWLHGTRMPEPRHFKGYQAEVLVQRAAQWMAECRARNADSSHPYFCVVSLEAPHPPYHAPAPHVREMTAAEVVLRPNVPTGGDVERKAREELAGYYAHIEATDRALGKLLAEVDLAETAVVFTSVHGDMHGSHGLFRKAWPHDESVRVPLLIRRRPEAGARRRQGKSDESPVSLVDLSHMAVAWAEGREWHCPRDHAAISMPAPTDIPLQCPHAWRGFRSVRHKLVLRTEADGRERPWLYFDLEQDPLEMRNLADDPARAGEIAEFLRVM